MRRVNESHRGFTAIYDGHTLKFALHKAPDLRASRQNHLARQAVTDCGDMMACSVFKDSVSALPGSATVR